MSKLFIAITWAMICCSIFVSLGNSQERVKQSADGVTVTLPADEADLAKPLLKLAKAWQVAMLRDDKKSYPAVLRAYILSPKATDNSLRHIAKFTGLHNGPDQAIRTDWDEATQLALKAVDGWKTWQLGFDTLNFWNKVEAEHKAQHQRNHWVFQDTIVQLQKNGAGIRIRPSFLQEPIDLETLPDPQTVATQQLDFVMTYRIGSSRGEIVRQNNDLMNLLLANPEKGALVRVAAELYEAIFRRVFEKALQRMLVTDNEGDHFRKALSLVFCAANNDTYDPKRGRKWMFGERIRLVASLEWEQSIETLAERMRNTPPWPTKNDGPAEQAVREVALAIIFTSLKNGGSTLDGWIRSQKIPLESQAFATRLDAATGDPGWKKIFRKHCKLLADQFVTALADQTKTKDHPSLSHIEQNWPRAVSGRVKVIHPPELAATAKLTAEKVAAILAEYATARDDARDTISASQFTQKHYAILIEHGLHPRKRSAAEWVNIFELIANDTPPELLVRLWFIDDMKEALKKGLSIPGIEKDESTGEISITSSLGRQKVFHTLLEEEMGKDGDTVSYLIVPVPRDKAATLSAELQSVAIAKKCRSDLDKLFQSTKSEYNREEFFFTMAFMVVGESLLRDIIASKDREWFAIGFSHWLAMRITDAQFGDGAGQRAFNQMWPADKNEPDRHQVDLLKWPTPDDREDSPFEATHVYYATRAMQEALIDKDAKFVKRFIDEIRKTPRKRTNMGTVYRAYKNVGGGNLKSYAQKVNTSAKTQKP